MPGLQRSSSVLKDLSSETVSIHSEGNNSRALVPGHNSGGDWLLWCG